MVDVVDFSGTKIAPGERPKRSSRYQACGLQPAEHAVGITLIRSNWSIVSFPYAMLGHMFFDSPDDEASFEDECKMDIAFCQVRGIPFGGDRSGFHVTVSGRRLHELFSAIGRHRVDWIWALPQDRPAPEDDQPVILSIGIERVSDVGTILPEDLLEFG